MGRTYLAPVDVPSVTTTQRNALTATDGEMVYNTTQNAFQVRINGAWQSMGDRGPVTVTLVVGGPLDAVVVADGQFIYRVPARLNGMDLIACTAHVTTVSSSGLPTVQLRNVTDSVDMLTTKITIDASEKDSSTAAAAVAIDTSHDDVATADEIAIDVDVAGTGAKGLSVDLTFALP